MRASFLSVRRTLASSKVPPSANSLSISAMRTAWLACAALRSWISASALFSASSGMQPHSLSESTVDLRVVGEESITITSMPSSPSTGAGWSRPETVTTTSSRLSACFSSSSWNHIVLLAPSAATSSPTSPPIISTTRRAIANDSCAPRWVSAGAPERM